MGVSIHSSYCTAGGVGESAGFEALGGSTKRLERERWAKTSYLALFTTVCHVGIVYW